MDIQFDDGYQARKISGAVLAGIAPSFLGFARGMLCLYFPVFRDQFVRNLEQHFQCRPQLYLCRGHRAGHDDCDHYRRHRPIGRLGTLPVQHDSRRRHACRLQHRGRHRGIAWNGAADRRDQWRADRISGDPAVRRHARHAVDRTQPGDGRIQQHRRVPVRTRSRQAVVSRWRRAGCSGLPIP